MNLDADHRANLARNAHVAGLALGEVIVGIGAEPSRPEGYEIPDLDDLRFGLQNWAVELAHDDPGLLAKIIPPRPGLDR